MSLLDSYTNKSLRISDFERGGNAEADCNWLIKSTFLVTLVCNYLTQHYMFICFNNDYYFLKTPNFGFGNVFRIFFQKSSPINLSSGLSQRSVFTNVLTIILFNV